MYPHIYLRRVRHNRWRGIKYYRFNGQVVAMRKNGVLSYLHGDHLGSTVATSNSSGNFSGQEWYHAYGRYRGGHELGSENRFTGQKLDATGLMYYNARYYDPELGQFLSPDTIVPDPTNLLDYNRYMYVRGNPMKYTDPTGHWLESALDIISLGATVKDINDNGLNWENGIGLAADVVSLAAPGVAGGGTVVRYADDAYAASKAGVNAAWDWGKRALGYGDEAAQYGDETASAAKAGADCLTNSFSADTLVMTPSGLKAISELVEGELVLAYNEATGQIGAYPITDVISHVDAEIVLLTIDGETLETTAEHPFYELEAVPGLAVGQYHPRWTDANELKAGDLVWQADGTTGAVQSIAIVARKQRMYNLTVAEAHTFFVGDGQWLVHNCRIPTASQISIPGPTNSPYGKVDYLLGKVPGSQESSGKGGFFAGVLGFTDDTMAPALQQHLLDNFGSAEFYTRQTSRASVTGIMRGTNGREARVTSVWELLEDGTYRFITATPAK